MKTLLGYANTWRIAPGETLSVKVSTYGPTRYRADLIRVICGDDDPHHDAPLQPHREPTGASDDPSLAHENSDSVPETFLRRSHEDVQSPSQAVLLRVLFGGDR